LVFRLDETRNNNTESRTNKPATHQCSASVKVSWQTRSFSLLYNDLARWLFITLAFTGILVTGWFGIPLVPLYFLNNEIDPVSALFASLSALGTIWGAMAYSEFTISATLINDTRNMARRINPMIGDYQYLSYNPETKDYEKGYVPMGPIDFWDRETQVPDWLDKGKYWHILLGLQVPNKEIILQVVKDSDLPFLENPRNVAVVSREVPPSQKKYRYRVKIPQWLVMSTEVSQSQNQNESWSIDKLDLGTFLTILNTKLTTASDEVVEREKPRIKYPWKISALGVYLNKSLPLRILYRKAVSHFPGARKRTIEHTNENLANIPNDQLIASIIDVATAREIPKDRIDKFRILVQFLKNEYSRQGIGEGSAKYHNFHHSLEVTFLSLQLLPKEFHGTTYNWKDYEFLLLAGILHDYDPSDAQIESLRSNHNNGSVSAQPKGPRVYRTIEELDRTRILDACFTMNSTEFENYFRDYKSSSLLPLEYSSTHAEYVKVDWKPTESLIVEALIWRTDFPFEKQQQSQRRFEQILSELKRKGINQDKIRLLGEIVWLADLSVTYMGSDPIRAWDRVSKLYDELYLPRFEAVTRTDAFFSDFADNDLFKELIHMRNFPEILRQRWNLVYQFFHEGNPSTQLNRTISNARRLYLKVNLDLGMRDCDMLFKIASNHWSEYFIGIGTDQDEVLRAKTKFASLDPQNASSFWGDTMKLVPRIQNKSIDNFFIVLSKNFSSSAATSFGKLLPLLKVKLTGNKGTVQIITDIDEDSQIFREVLSYIASSSFKLSKTGRVYFPKDWDSGSSFDKHNTRVILLRDSHEVE
jgi:hypothetical protein